MHILQIEIGFAYIEYFADYFAYLKDILHIAINIRPYGQNLHIAYKFCILFSISRGGVLAHRRGFGTCGWTGTGR